MEPTITRVPRPDWSPLPHAGCDGVDGKVLLRGEDLAVAMLRFSPAATIHEHPAPFPIDVICLEGERWTSVDGDRAHIREGDGVRWPAGHPHRLWTDGSTMITLMIERVSERTDG